jgi:hypothetical protein
MRPRSRYLSTTVALVAVVVAYALWTDRSVIGSPVRDAALRSGEIDEPEHE